MTLTPFLPRAPGRGRALLALGAAGLLAATLGAPPEALASAPSATSGTVRVGDFAPDFTLTSTAGATVRLADLLGKRPVLLVFWSFFCFPCQREMPDIQDFVNRLGPDNLAVLAVCLDGPSYDDRVIPFLEQKGITFPVVHDKETVEYFEVAEKYGVVGTPTFFLLDAQGRVRLINLGRLDQDMLVGAVKAAREQAFCAEITKPPPKAAK